MTVDLVYFDGCPHVAAARRRLHEALDSLSLPVRWSEWDTQAPTTPEHLRGHSSPTVLVNGVDVEGKAAASGSGCAVGGGPSLEVLRRALAAAKT
jgi:hypothetical protein